jgi:hypothetical protein
MVTLSLHFGNIIHRILQNKQYGLFQAGNVFKLQAPPLPAGLFLQA